MRCGLSRLRCFTRPRSANTFSCAFSRTEQVLNTMTSASSALAAVSRPSAARSTSAILSESYSFIWQPKVRRKSFPTLLAFRFLGREEPYRLHQAVRVELVLDPRAGGNRARQHDAVVAVADLHALREAALRTVDLHDHLLHVADLAPHGVLRNSAQLRPRRGAGEQQEQQGEARHRHGEAGQWWRIRDSNPGHTDYDSAALTS